jgi:hypothetical protein
MQTQPAPRDHERARHPARFKPENSATRSYRFLNTGSIDHAGLFPLEKVDLPERTESISTTTRVV